MRVIWSVVSTNLDQLYALFNQLQALSNQLYAPFSISCLCHWISSNISLISCTHNSRSGAPVIRSVGQFSNGCVTYVISCTLNFRSFVRVIRSVVHTIHDQLCMLFDQLLTLSHQNLVQRFLLKLFFRESSFGIQGFLSTPFSWWEEHCDRVAIVWNVSRLLQAHFCVQGYWKQESIILHCWKPLRIGFSKA